MSVTLRRDFLEKPELRFGFVAAADNPRHMVAALLKGKAQQIIGPHAQKREQAELDGDDDTVDVMAMELGNGGDQIKQQYHQKRPVAAGGGGNHVERENYRQPRKPLRHQNG